MTDQTRTTTWSTLSNGKTMATNTTPGNQPKTSETHDGSSNDTTNEKSTASNKRYQARIRERLQQSKIKEILADETRGQFANHYYLVRWKDGHHDSWEAENYLDGEEALMQYIEREQNPKTRKNTSRPHKWHAKHNGRYGMSATEGH